MNLSDGSKMKGIIWAPPLWGHVLWHSQDLSSFEHPWEVLSPVGQLSAFVLRVCCRLLLLGVILINRKYITCLELSVRSLGQSAPDTQKNSPLLANRQLFSGLYRNWYSLLTGIPEPRWWWQMLTRKNFYTETCVLKSFLQMFFSPGK